MSQAFNSAAVISPSSVYTASDRTTDVTAGNENAADIESFDFDERLLGRSETEASPSSPNAGNLKKQANSKRVAPLGLVHVSEYAHPRLDGQWMVDGLLPESGLAVLYGPSGTGKTFLALDLAMTVSGKKTKWAGRSVFGGSVIYAPLEGENGIQNRISAYTRSQKVDNSLWIARRPILLDQKSDILGPLVSCQEYIGKDAPQIRMLVLDTLARFMSGHDENNSSDMSRAIRALENISRQLRCLVLVVHHSGKDGDRGPRGHSSLRAAASTVLKVKKTKDSYRLELEKQRDGRGGDTFEFGLEDVFLGKTPAGDQITSCVIANLQPVRPTSPSLSENEHKLWTFLKDWVADNPTSIKRELQEMGAISAVDGPAFREDAKTLFQVTNAKNAVDRAIDGLKKKGKIVFDDQQIGIIDV